MFYNEKENMFILRGEVMKKMVLFLLVIFSFTYLFSAFNIPRYTKNQLEDKTFVVREIKKLEKIKNNIIKKEEKCSQLEKLALETDVNNLDATLELLNYVKKNGYMKNDTKLLSLKYFSLVPHVMKPNKKDIKKKTVSRKSNKRGVILPVLKGDPKIDFTGTKFKNLSGIVKVLLFIDEKGNVEKVNVLKAPDKGIGEYVKDFIIKQWKFKPALKNGKPVRVKYGYLINLSKSK